jgi:4-hydroxybenzoate polyprenyltransferase
MSRLSEIKSFVVHLRWHYQVFILPAGYLLGGLFAPALDVRTFAAQFLVVHLLLNGGVTAYNSFFDDDDGPIGGLEHPPKLAPWSHWASIVVQLIGLALSLPLGPAYAAIYLVTMLLSVLYSSKRFRWKGHPLLSLVAVGIGTGTNTFLLGYLAARSGGAPEPEIFVAAIGVASMLLSLYPVSQIFQRDADRLRSDRTFAIAFGVSGVRRFFAGAYIVGSAIVALSLEAKHAKLGIAFALVGAAGGAVIALRLARLTGSASEYRPVMRLKYFTSMLFSMFVVLCLLIVHGGVHA